MPALTLVKSWENNHHITILRRDPTIYLHYPPLIDGPNYGIYEYSLRNDLFHRQCNKICCNCLKKNVYHKTNPIIMYFQFIYHRRMTKKMISPFRPYTYVVCLQALEEVLHLSVGPPVPNAPVMYLGTSRNLPRFGCQIMQYLGMKQLGVVSVGRI